MVCSAASRGATAVHIACVWGCPWSRRSGGPSPPRRRRIVASPVSIVVSSKPSNTGGERAANLEPVRADVARLDAAAGRRDDVLHDREPEARAPGGARLVGAVEALEDPRQILLGDAAAVV